MGKRHRNDCASQCCRLGPHSLAARLHAAQPLEHVGHTPVDPEVPGRKFYFRGSRRPGELVYVDRRATTLPDHRRDPARAFRPRTGPPDHPVFDTSLNSAFVFAIWLSIYFTIVGIRQLKGAALRQSELARALQQAELRLLKSQLNPHFLFNALNTVRSLIADDPARAQHAVTRLANTLRYALGAGQNDLVSLSRELEIVADYLEIEKMRFEERLTIESEIATDAGEAQIPVSLLQTVVENAIKHGIAELPAGGVLRISAVLASGMLVMTVENPRPLAASPSAREGTGLRNAEERLRLLFDARASLELDLSQPARATTRIRIPQHS